MRNLGIAIVIIIWLLLGWWLCHYNCQNCCNVPKTVPISESVTPITTTQSQVQCPDVPICFLDNVGDANLGSSFNVYRDSIIASMKPGQRLQIIGLYGASEPTPEGFENMGLYRANFIKNEFAKFLDPNLIDIGSQLTVGQSGESLGYSSDRIRFAMADAAVKSEVPNSTLIYFPFNSTDKLDDGVVEVFLAQVAARVKDSG